MKRITKLAIETLEKRLTIMSSYDLAKTLGGNGPGGDGYWSWVGGQYVFTFNGGVMNEIVIYGSSQASSEGNWYGVYTGPNNPSGYVTPPINLLDLMAKIHDQDYDDLGASGASGLFLEQGTALADLKLIAGSFLIATGIVGDATDFEQRLAALAVSMGISVGVLVKGFINGSAAVHN